MSVSGQYRHTFGDGNSLALVWLFGPRVVFGRCGPPCATPTWHQATTNNPFRSNWFCGYRNHRDNRRNTSYPSFRVLFRPLVMRQAPEPNCWHGLNRLTPIRPPRLIEQLEISCAGGHVGASYRCNPVAVSTKNEHLHPVARVFLAGKHVQARGGSSAVFAFEIGRNGPP